VKIPNFDRAVIDSRKLEGYCLNASHPRGKHKARIFAKHGITESDYLRRLLLDAIVSAEVRSMVTSLHGVLYVLEFPWRAVSIKSIWMVRKNEDFPRLVSCYIPSS